MFGKNVFPAPNRLDVFVTDPHTHEEMLCQVCGMVCDVTRDHKAMSNAIAGQFGMAKPHDRFICPHYWDEWHRQAHQLCMEIERTPSRRIAELLALDLADILKENGKG
jgi:hypothetical protein